MQAAARVQIVEEGALVTVGNVLRSSRRRNCRLNRSVIVDRRSCLRNDTTAVSLLSYFTNEACAIAKPYSTSETPVRDTVAVRTHIFHIAPTGSSVRHETAVQCPNQASRLSCGVRCFKPPNVTKLPRAQLPPKDSFLRLRPPPLP